MTHTRSSKKEMGAAFNRKEELWSSSPDWTVLDSRCECPIARNLMNAFGCGGWI